MSLFKVSVEVLAPSDCFTSQCMVLPCHATLSSLLHPVSMTTCSVQGHRETEMYPKPLDDTLDGLPCPLQDAASHQEIFIYCTD